MNPVIGETPLELSDGRKFTLVLGMRALAIAEGVYGKPAQAITQDSSLGYVGALGALLYGALKKHQPLIDLDEATDMLGADIAAIRAALDEAAALGFGKGDKEAGNAPKSRPRGKTSGASGAKPG